MRSGFTIYNKPVRADTVYRKGNRAIFKVRSTVTLFVMGSVLRTFGKDHCVVPINGANPNGLFKYYFYELFEQRRQYFEVFFNKKEVYESNRS
jgi:hypothetical protein